MKNTLKVLFSFVLFFFLATFLYSEFAGSAKVTKIYGTVEENKKEKGVWQNAAKDDLLVENDMLRTGLNSYAEMEIGAGNSVRLKEKSQITVKSIESEMENPDGSVIKLTDFNLLDGEMVLKLNNLPKSTLVQVSSPTAVAGARGTAFSTKYNSTDQMTSVGVLDHAVSVSSAGEQGKEVLVTQYKKVSVTPWALATPQVRGGGILSEKILGKQFIENAKNSFMEAEGAGDTEESAKTNAYYNLSKKVLSISVAPERRIEDILNDDVSICQPLYSYIAKAEISAKGEGEGKFTVKLKLELGAISDIIKTKLPPMPSIVKPISLKEYGETFGAQARVTTERAAQLDGYRKLAELMFGTVIKSETTLQDMAITNDKITNTVEGVVKGAEILSTQYFSDGSVTVVMAIRADLVRLEVAKITGEIFGLNFMTKPVVIDIDDFLNS